MKAPWIRVLCAPDCDPCTECGEPLCPRCEEHFADCNCPGPTMEDEYTYHVDDDGVLWALATPDYSLNPPGVPT